jgi:dolichol-phosphate mannosyltransferase
MSLQFLNPQPQPSRSQRTAPREVAILIPAYNPGAALELLVARLTYAGVPAILLVDDGSCGACQKLFARLAANPRVHLLRHAQNLGKGAALKTGIRYFLEHLSHYKGVVTADADGQHAAEDVLRVARCLHKSPHLAILGARTFHLLPDPIPAARASGGPLRAAETAQAAAADWASTSAPPLRSVLGNRISAALFRALTRVPLADAQTGLRALPTTALAGLLPLPGTRYEFEMSVLLHLVRSGHPIAEQPIHTVYAEENAGSHFRPLVDSARVLFALLRPAAGVLSRDRCSAEQRTEGPRQRTPAPSGRPVPGSPRAPGPSPQRRSSLPPTAAAPPSPTPAQD